jgi:hypothetical protein
MQGGCSHTLMRVCCVLRVYAHVSTQTLEQHKNVVCHLGSSAEVLRHIAPELSKLRAGHVLLYLDAHAPDIKWPILDELAVAAKYWKNRVLVVIDDMKASSLLHPR